MKKVGYLFFILIIVFSLCSCSVTEEGETLHSFTKRINKINYSYNLSPTGYIYDEDNSSLTKFFRFNDNELMLRFKLNKEFELKKQIIIFNKALLNNNKAHNFIIDLIKSFIHNDQEQNALITKLNLKKLSQKKASDTQTFQSVNTILMIDITERYMYITVLKNNL